MMETRAYERMLEDIKERIGADEEPSVIEDVAKYGADAGYGGFTYTSDCVEFYELHRETIWEMAQGVAEQMGYSNVPELVATFVRSDMADTEDGFKNLLAWYTLETVCQDLVDQGAHIPECEECLGILEDDGSCADCDAIEAEDAEEDEDEDEPEYIGWIVVFNHGPEQKPIPGKHFFEWEDYSGAQDALRFQKAKDPMTTFQVMPVINPRLVNQ